ncbi:MAG: sugar-binding transcriptional regulator [Catenisphaera adipataccumulans]|jgi:deoxyribonucleoside regulator|uniref:sugar-binding transcriptional regulator n=1 Tax=Catenisphaera adipataccumulans TaxID=700500 RepID=UPI003D8BE1D7
MNQYRMNQILRVAKMHYELGMSQIEIAKKEHMSKSTVSRLIQQAHDQGLVQITIRAPIEESSDLEMEIMKRFHLKKVVIVNDIVGNRTQLLRDLCRTVAEDLNRMVRDDTIVGVDWGRTTSTLSTQLINTKRRCRAVIQLNGGISRTLFDSQGSDTIRRFSNVLHTDGFLFPAPAMVDSEEIAHAIMSDSSIQKIFSMAENCETAIYSPGCIGYDSTLYQMGYFTKQEYDRLAQNAVGDVFSHYLDINGHVVDAQQDARVISVPLDMIKKIPNKVIVSVGPAKMLPTLGCLRGGYADTLYIDRECAGMLLKADKGQ